MGLFGPPDVKNMIAKGDIKGVINTLNYKKDPKIRREAARAFIEVGPLIKDERLRLLVVRSLILSLKDWQGGVDAAAAEALGQIGDIQAVLPLINQMDRMSTDARAAALRALGHIGMQIEDPVLCEQVIVAIIIKIKDKEACIRQEGAKALGLIFTKVRAPALHAKAARELIGALEDKESQVRMAASASLGQVGCGLEDPEIRNLAIKALIPTQKIQDEDECNSMVTALIKFSMPSAERLIALLKLKPNHDAVRWKAASALDKIGWKPGLDEDGAAYWIGKMEWEKCIEIGAPAVKPLMNTFWDTSKSGTNLRLAVVDTLAKIGEPAIEPLLWLNSENNNNAKNQSIQALVKIDASAVESLIKDGEPVNGRAITVLQQIYAQVEDAGLRTRIANSFIARLKDDSWRTLAADALKSIGWTPGQDVNGVFYYIARKEMYKCAEIGAPAVEPLIAVVKGKIDHGHTGKAISALGEAGTRWTDNAIKIRIVEVLLSPRMDGINYLQLFHEEIVASLGKIGYSIVEYLIDVLRNADPKNLDLGYCVGEALEAISRSYPNDLSMKDKILQVEDKINSYLKEGRKRDEAAREIKDYDAYVFYNNH